MIKDMLKTFRSKWHSDLVIGVEQNKRQEQINSVYLKNILSYINNKVMTEQGTAVKSSKYRYFYKLHKLLEVKSIDETCCSFIRMGKVNDGGYLMVRNDEDDSLSGCRIAYSLGICHDVSLDLELARKGYHVFQYDHTIDRLPKDCKRFHWRKLGITGGSETDQLKSLETVMRMDKNLSRKGMILKCDIEGSEWDMLEYCSSETLSRFDQIVIELHGLHDLERQENTLKLLEKLSATHQAVHIHANNNVCVDYSYDLITPDVIEVTYVLKSKYNTTECSKMFPTELDQPNAPDMADMYMGKWNV